MCRPTLELRIAVALDNQVIKVLLDTLPNLDRSQPLIKRWVFLQAADHQANEAYELLAHLPVCFDVDLVRSHCRLLLQISKEQRQELLTEYLRVHTSSVATLGREPVNADDFIVLCRARTRISLKMKAELGHDAVALLNSYLPDLDGNARRFGVDLDCVLFSEDELGRS